MIVLPFDLPPLNAAIIRAAQADVPILENPPLSNRSPEIDAMCQQFGVPLGSYWCALWAAKCWTEAGAEIPPTEGDSHPAKAESWHLWSLKTLRFSAQPILGAATLYGNGGHGPADHIGATLASIHPFLMDFQGNTSGAGFSRNGELATLKSVDTARLIGYVSPTPLSGDT